jgi:hypothetical protein
MSESVRRRTRLTPAERRWLVAEVDHRRRELLAKGGDIVTAGDRELFAEFPGRARIARSTLAAETSVSQLPNPNGALGPLLELIAAELAPRLAADLAGQAAHREEAEPWRLLTLEEAAARLGRSTRWLRDRKEQIGYVRLDGGALSFRLEDLQAFAEQRRVGGWNR